jgi:predicted MPP superfamily phosphohydrolase
MAVLQLQTQSPARPLLTRRRFLVAATLASASVAFYSNDVARHEIEVTHPTFFIKNLPPAFHGFRIAQISDLHLEEYTEDYFLRRVIDHVNDLAPDMVLVTGDFISRGPLTPVVSFQAAGRCGELLSRLRCPLRYGILGNHDAAVSSQAVRFHMEDNGLPMLVNQCTRVEYKGDHIFLAGLDDAEFGRPDLDATLPPKPDAPVILLVHEPDYADQVVKHPAAENVDLILSGHTHGGQIRLPFFGPLALPPGGQLYPEGHYQIGSSQLYVNRGIGTVGVPFRLNCPPEITLSTLRPA